MSQSVRLKSRARKHSLNHTFTQKCVFIDDLSLKTCICQFFFVSLHPIWVHQTNRSQFVTS